jgi:hypothetical protein
MSEPDRGAYTPQTDAPLAFDARQSRGGGGPAPLTLLVSAIVLMGLIVGLLLFYRHGVRHAGQAPELVGAPVGQTKSAPSSDAASDNQAAGLQVYKAEATPPSETGPQPSFATPPEQPAPLPAARPIQPTPSVIRAEPLRGVTAAPSAPKPAPKPVIVAKALPPPAAKAPPPPPAPAAPDTSNIAGSAFASHAPSPPRPAATPAPSHVAAAAPAKPAAPPALAAAPKASSAAKPASSAKPKPGLATPSVSPETASASAGASGGVMVQIGAFSSTALAQKGWSDDAHAVPGAMAGKTRKVEAATKDGKTFYRAYVGGFASKADAASFCAALKAKDRPCFIAK